MNSLSEVDVITGGFSAEFGDAQSGIINYVTRSGGRRWMRASSAADRRVHAQDELAGPGPPSFRALVARSAGNLGFFVAGTAEGRSASNSGKLWRNVLIYVANGVEPSSAHTPAGTTDSRDVVFPSTSPTI